MDADTRDKLIDLYTRYGDQLTPAAAATRLVRVEASESKRQPARLYHEPGPTGGAAPTALHSKIRAKAHHA